MVAISDTFYNKEEQLAGGADTNSSYGLQINEAIEYNLQESRPLL